MMATAIPGPSGNNSDIASGVEDLKAAVPVDAQETGQKKVHFTDLVRRYPCCGLRAGGARASRPTRALRLHLQG